ncbi:MAG: CaiB/BaiF CoA transferase family protein [Dehalococcoidia bacterium]|tara:strand:+ start:3993 stop:5228 length:1236 start_codon:yes stop_codon:yes gene_type:complete
MPKISSPLEGIRVIDLGRHQAGPRCAQVLARLGAEVIKIERLGGEETRYHAPWVEKQSAYWVQYNSGKKSVSMDLRTESGKEILRELVKVSDVVVQNFRPGTIAKMGFSYDVLKSLNPKIVMVNVSAYGQFGPYTQQIGFDPIGQVMSGIAMVTGFDGMPPIRAGVPIIDRITALHSAIGTLAALREREISGEGQAIDTCLADTGYSLTEIPITAYHGVGTKPSRGEGDEKSAPSGMYECADGNWILISAGDQHHWPRVCKALGEPTWVDDERFNTRHNRGLNGKIVNDKVNSLLEDLDMKQALKLFTDNDVVAAAVNTIPMAAEDPHPWERRAMVEVDDFLAGSIAVSGDFWHFSRTPAVIGTTPKVGEHNKEVIVDLLKYSEAEYNSFLEEKSVADWDLYEEIPGAYRK